MSVVVWDGRTLAADRQATDGDIRTRCKKIRKLPSGDLIGWVGSGEEGLALAEWYASGADPGCWPESQKGDNWARLIVVHHGKVWEYCQLPVKQHVKGKQAAWGSGASLALGAMGAGADAIQAVKIASKFNIYCGLGVDHYEVA
jgi:hypothetical protein